MKRDRRGARLWCETEFSADDLVLPRPSVSLDADRDGRALLMLAVNIGTRHGDPVLAFGIDFRGNPGSLCWRFADWLEPRLDCSGSWRPFG